MTAWNEGYVADIPYTSGFFRETVPAHIAFSTLCAGRDPGAIVNAKRVLDLGFGMGFGLVLTAAANPGVIFEGIDFNPLHVVNAQGLADEAQLANVELREASFQDLAREAREGQHDVDLIILHGIFTWVSDEARAAIVEIARKRLRPGGLLYVSYNAMPGQARMLPVQHLFRTNARRAAGRSDAGAESSIALLKTMLEEGAGFFKTMPDIDKVIERLGTRDKSYIAHEYLNSNWTVFHFAEVADALAEAKLDYAGTATLIENFDRLSVPAPLRPRLEAESDPVFRETLRDIAVNKAFRRDLFGRGVPALRPAERQRLLAATRLILAVPSSRVKYEFATPLGDVKVKREVCDRIYGIVAEAPASVADILARFTAEEAETALDTLGLLAHAGIIQPTRPNEAAIDREPARRFNRMIVRMALEGRTHDYLAAPVLGAGAAIPRTEMLMIAAAFDGQAGTAEALAAHVAGTMDRLGIAWVRDGKPLTDPAEREAVLRRDGKTFLTERLPLWQRLGVI